MSNKDEIDQAADALRDSVSTGAAANVDDILSEIIGGDGSYSPGYHRMFSKYDAKSAALVLTVRIFLSAILFGGMMSFAYSALGGAVCLAGEYLIDKFFKGKALYITAIFGAVLHNAAQLLVAIGFTNTPGVLLYAPYLVISGIVTGLLTGVAAYFSLKLLKKV